MVDVTVYWRPGCMFCSALMRKLDRLAVPYRRVDIWSDPDAAELVRQAGGGSETVPAVRVGAEILSNPSAQEVLAAAHRVDPGTDLPAPAPPGRVARALWRLLGGGTPP